MLGNVYNFLPFMILPIYTRAHQDRQKPHRGGAGPGRQHACRVFRKVIFPLSTVRRGLGHLHDLYAGGVTTFVISRLLGGGQQALIGDIIENQFKVVGNWGLGSAMSVVLMVSDSGQP